MKILYPAFTRYVHELSMLVVCGLFLCLIAAPRVAAQTDSATLRGTIVDATEAALPGVKVRISNPATALQRETVTDNAGNFTVLLLPPGTYKVTAEREGFARLQVADVVLNASDQRLLRLNLQVGNVAVSIETKADRANIETSAAVATVVDKQFVERLPLNGRSVQSLLLLSPGVVVGSGDGQLSFNGGRTNANYFTLDGVSANIGAGVRGPTIILGPQGATGNQDQRAGGSIPGFNSFGGTNSLISVDALQEFKVQSSMYGAEFGRQSGGQIQMTSKSGTNEYHGTLFDYFRNDALDAADFFDKARNLKKPALRQNDFGGVLGGPVRLPKSVFGPLGYDGRNRTFFFFSYEGLRLVQPQSVNDVKVPAQFLRADTRIKPEVKALLLAMPAPNAPDDKNAQGQLIGTASLFRSLSNRRDLDATSIRIDQNAGNGLTMFGRYNDAPSGGVTPGLGLDNLFTVNVRTVTAGAQMIFSSRLSNEVRYNYSFTEAIDEAVGNARDGAQPINYRSLLPANAPVNSTVTFTYLNNLFQTLGPATRNLQRQQNVVDNLTWALGSHTLKFGFDYRLMTPQYAPRAYALSFTFSSLTDLNAAVANNVTVTANDGVSMHVPNYSAYAQDSWRINQRLSVDFGVRWDVNPPPRALDGLTLLTLTGVRNVASLPSVKLAPIGTPLYPTRYNGFGPRFGAAYLLRQKTGWETTLRGGYGLYLDLGVGTAGVAATQYPFSRQRALTTANSTAAQRAFPLNADALSFPPAATTTPPIPANANFTVFADDYVLPRSHQWTFALSQGLGANNTLTLSYVGNAGRRLLRRYFQTTSTTAANANTVVPFNPDLPGARISYTSNASDLSDTSDYHALQIQFTKRLSRGLQVLANHTWSHAIDTGSDDFSSSYFFTAANPLADRGASEFDRRHIFNTALSYDLPKPANSSARALIYGWSTDVIFKAQSAAPVNVTFGRNMAPIVTQTYVFRPDLVSGQPIWIDAPGTPGNRRLNRDAFRIPPEFIADARNFRQGTLPRNGLRGFGVTQLDFALGRQFSLTERVKLQFKGELFNVLNHPNFNQPSASLGSISGTTLTQNANFGASNASLARSFGASSSSLNSLYQIGGPRSVQLALKLKF